MEPICLCDGNAKSMVCSKNGYCVFNIKVSGPDIIRTRSGDMFRCPVCQGSIITGFGDVFETGANEMDRIIENGNGMVGEV